MVCEYIVKVIYNRATTVGGLIPDEIYHKISFSSEI